MNIENTKNRLQVLKDRHKKQHDIVEALEGEKAPEKIIKKAKLEKLTIKDEIVSLEAALEEREINAN
jgi:hypothetical protein